MARPTLTCLIAGCLLAGFTTAVQAQIRNFEPITDAELLDPDPGDWINCRRTIDGQGYSPLDQINRDNVGSLQLVWSWETLAGTDEVTPLVHDGVMYIPSRSGVVALDATTGDVLWSHLRTGRPMPSNPDRPSNQQPGLARRNIAIYDDKIYAGTSEAQLIALDARTGEVVWEQQVADHDLGYQYTSGPIIVKGMVVAGITGCEYYKNDVCFISAHDAQTGAELWRTSTVARPGEPGGDTWGDLTLTFRAGADAWIPGSYDADADLIYWSTAQPKPWASAQRGTEGAALYSNSTLALDPETGEIEWYYQHIPAETHDLDEVFEVVVVDRGDGRALFKMGKIGVLWELDPKTGEHRAAHDLGYQDIVDLHPTSGQGILRRERIPQLNVPVDYCPGPGGLKNLWAMAYHPETEAFYIPLTPGCAHSTFKPMPEPAEIGGGGIGPADRRFTLSSAEPPAPRHLRGDGQPHRRAAVDPPEQAAIRHVGADDRRRPRLRRQHRPQHLCDGRPERRGAVADAHGPPRPTASRSRTPWTAGSTSPCRRDRAGSWRGATLSWCSTTCSGRGPAAPSCTCSRCRNSQ